MQRVKKQINTYPAMLSQLALAVKDCCELGEHVKDMLEYNNCFQGRQAIVSAY
jgi:hypothetical protein